METRSSGFEVLLEYMYSGKLTEEDFYIKSDSKNGVKECISFVEYAVKHDFSAASIAVYDSFKNMIVQGGNLEGSDIKDVFHLTSTGDYFRALVTQAACQQLVQKLIASEDKNSQLKAMRMNTCTRFEPVLLKDGLGCGWI